MPRCFLILPVHRAPLLLSWGNTHGILHLAVCRAKAHLCGLLIYLHKGWTENQAAEG